MAKQLNKSRQEVVLEFTADTKKAEKELKSLQNSLERLANKNLNTTDLSVTKDLKEASNAALKLRNNIQSAMNTDTGKLDLSKFQKAMQQSNMSLEEYYKQLIKLGPSGEQAFASLASSISKADVKVKHVNKTIQEMKDTFSNTIRWQVSSSVLHGLMGAVQSAYGYAQDLNESLNNIRIVTGYSTDQMSKFAEQANRAARALSTTTTEYTNASLIYYQQGLSDAEVQQRTDITIKMANVARQSAEVVSDQMTAIWNNFYDGSKSLEHYANVMTALGAKTASSTDEIAGGLEKFAAVADTIGLSYEYAASALATITSNTRESEEVVGTALKTIFARIQGLNLGETLDDGTNLNKYSKALQTVGISIFDQAGQLKEMDAILDELGNKWETIDKAEQVALAQTVAGVRQYTQLVALMDNWNDNSGDSFQENLATANNSAGALQEQADIYSESWEAAKEEVTAAAEEIYAKLINDEGFITLLKGIEVVLSGVSSLIDGVGGLNGVLTITTTLLMKSFGKEMASGLASTGRMIKNISTYLPFGNKKQNNNNGNNNPANLKTDIASLLMNGNDSLETPLGDATAATFKGMAELQQLMLTNADNLTAEEKERLQILLDQNAALGENVRLYANAATKAKENAVQQTGVVTSHYDDVTKRMKINSYAGLMNDSGQLVMSGRILSSVANSKNKNNYKSAADKTIKDIETFKYALKESGLFGDDVFKGFEGEIDSIKSEIEGIDFDKDDSIEQAKTTLEKINGEIEKIINKIKGGAIEQIFGPKPENPDAEYDAQVKEVEGLGETHYNAGLQEGQSKGNIWGYGESVRGIRQTVDEDKLVTPDKSQQIVAGAQALMSYAGAIQSVVGAFQTLQNDDLNTWEKLTAVVGSMVSNIVMVTSASIGLTTALKGSTAAWAGTATAIANFIPPLMIATAVIAGIVWLIDALVETPAEKIAKLKKEQEKLNDELTETNSKLDKINSAFDRYNSVINTLNSCVKGTEAWNTALENVNTTVQDLIAEFPELLTGNWISRGENGELVIDPEFFEQNQEKYKRERILTNNGLLQNAVDQNEATIDEKKQELKGKINGYYGYIFDNLTDEQYVELANMSKDERIKYYQKLGITDDVKIENIEQGLSSVYGDLQALAKALSNREKLKNNTNSYNANSFIELSGKEYDQAIIESAGAIYQKAYDEKKNSFAEDATEVQKQQIVESEFNYQLDELNAQYEQAKELYGESYAAALVKYKTNQSLSGFTSEELSILAQQEGKNVNEIDVDGAYIDSLDSYKTKFGEFLGKNADQFSLDNFISLESMTEEVQRKLGDSGVSFFKQILANSGEHADELTKLLANVNWGDPASVQKLNDEIEKQGLAVDTSSEAWQNYVAMMQESARAMDLVAIGIDSLRQNLADINKIVQNIKIGDIISDEDYAKLIATNPELEKFFGIAAEGYKFLGTENGESLTSYLLEDSKKSLEELKTEYIGLQSASKAIEDMFDEDTGEFLYKEDKGVNRYLSSIDDSLYSALGYNKEEIQNHIAEINKYGADEESEEYQRSLKEVEGFYSALESIHRQYENGKFESVQAEELWASSLALGVKELNDAYSKGSLSAVTYAKYLQQMADMDISNILSVQEVLAANGELSAEQSAYLDNLEKQWDELAAIADRTSLEYQRTLIDIENTINGMKIQNLVAEYTNIEIDVNANTDPLEEQLDELTSKNRQIIVEIVTDAKQTADVVNDQIDGILSAASKIGAGYLVARDDIASVADAFPGILEEAQVLADGSIQLSQAKANAAIQGVQAEIDANKEKARIEIEDNIAALQAKIDYNNAVIELASADLGNIQELQEKKGEAEAKYANYLGKVNQKTLENNEKVVDEKIEGAQKVYDGHVKAADKSSEAWDENFKEMVQNSVEASNLMIDHAAAVARVLGKEIDATHVDSTYVGGTVETGAEELSKYDNDTNVDTDVANSPEIQAAFEAMSMSEADRQKFIDNLKKENEFSEQQIQILRDQLMILQSSSAISQKQFNQLMQGLGGALGGNKAQPATKIKETKKTDIVERYKEVNDVLDDTVDLLKDVEKVSNRAYGKTHINGLKAQNHYLEEQIQLLQVKYKQAEQYLALDKQALQQAAGKAGLSSFTFDDFGNITNYTPQMTKMYDELHAAEVHWNSIYKTKTQADQQKYMTEVIDPIKEKIEGLQDAIKQYDETRELMEDVQNEIDDAFYQWQDNNYEILHYTLEIEIELKDMDLKRISYYIDKMEDNFYDMAEAAKYMQDQLPIWLEQLKDYEEFYQGIKGAFNNGEDSSLDYVDGMASAFANGNVSQLDYVNGMKEAYDAIIEILGSIHELDKAMLHYYGDTLKAASEELSVYTDHMEHLTSVLGHYKDMVKLVNGEFDYVRVGTILRGQADSLRGEMDVLNSNYEMLLREKNEIYESYMNATGEKQKEFYEQQLKDVTAAVDEAHEQMLAKTQEWAETEREILENSVAAAAKDLENALSNNMGFDALMDSIDRLSTYQDIYLTKTNQIYETQKMMRTAQKAADATDNQASKVKLKNFMLETQSLQEKNILSKLELEIQQAKYDMLMAQIALEDAQNAKSMVRLQRDNEGNFGYVYTSNMEAISQKEQELADAENGLYNVSLDAANEYGQRRLELQQQLADELIALAERRNNGEFETDALYYAEKDRILAQYNSLFIAYSDNYTAALAANADVQHDSWIQAYTPMIKSSDELSASTKNLFDTCEKAYKDWREVMEEDGKIISDVLHDFSTETEKITNSTREYAELLENKIIPNLEKELGLVRDLTGAYADQRDEINDMVNDYEDTMDDIYDDVEEETYRDGDYPLKDMPKVDPNIKGTGSKGQTKVEEEETNPNTGAGGGEVTYTSAQLEARAKAKKEQDKAWSDYERMKENSDGSSLSKLAVQIALNKYKEARDKVNATYDTGGYTGAWGSDGRLAVLHQKELVLNADDTKNFLAATEILRSVSQFIDLQVASNAFATRRLTSSTLTSSNGTLEQIVTIEANFPSVQDRNEIQEAFNNLINTASQYANRKL